MSLTSKIKNVVDLPVWEFTRFLPTNTTSTSYTCYGDGPNERYMYYLAGGALYRYDTVSDGWDQLASPPITPATVVSMRYSSYGGYRGNILSGSISGAVIAGINGNILHGYTIRITSGAGAGQDRLITSVKPKTIIDNGVITTTTATTIFGFTDNTKKWGINEHIGRQVTLIGNTGQSQVRKVLYNDHTSLYFYDVNYQQLEAWNNTQWSAVAPYALPVVTAGSQTKYQIEENEIVVSEPWDIIPDESSSYVIMSGGIWLISSFATAPWSSFQYYDIETDTWTQKTGLGGLLTAALGTDVTIERTGEVGGLFLSGSSISSTSRTLTVSLTSSLSSDRYANYQLRIISGDGIGQRKRIVQNNENTFWVESNWTTNPTTASMFAIYGNTNRIYLMGNGQASVYKYDTEYDLWFQGNSIDFGQTRNTSLSFQGQEPYGINTISFNNTANTAMVAVSPLSGGANYTIGDRLNLSPGTSPSVIVTGISEQGAITSVNILNPGTTMTTGTKTTTLQTSSSGIGATMNVTLTGYMQRLNLVTSHNLYVGDVASISGFTGTSANVFNQTVTCYPSNIGTVNVLFESPLSNFSSANTITANANSTTAVVDSSKNWTVNEHIGKIVMVNTAGASGTTQARRITANTATTLTLQSALAAGAINGTSRYVIHQPQAFGRAILYTSPEKSNEGKALSGTTGSLTDTTKNWFPNQWQNYTFRINSGVGVGSELTITSNTINTLSYIPQSFTPDSSTDYIIMDSFGKALSGTTGSLTDTTKNWPQNIWAGNRCRITSGLGLGQEFTVTANTFNTLSFAVITTAPDVNTTYTILGTPVRSTGVEANWVYGNTNENTKGKYIFIPRGGGSNIIDQYNINNETWDPLIFLSPNSRTWSTGSMWAYDGGSRIYYTVNATGRVGYVDVDNYDVKGAGMSPSVHSTAIIGNRMEVVTTDDGLKYLYIMKHTGNEMWRTLLFW